MRIGKDVAGAGCTDLKLRAFKGFKCNPKFR
jgi:hypothetical protein